MYRGNTNENILQCYEYSEESALSQQLLSGCYVTIKVANGEGQVRSLLLKTEVHV